MALPWKQPSASSDCLNRIFLRLSFVKAALDAWVLLVEINR
jgi:hypothetical protein